jgi:hypothetical protein
MATAITSLTAAQQAFATFHAVNQVEESFALGNVFMYHDTVAFTERWLVRPDGTTAEQDRFDRS